MNLEEKDLSAEDTIRKHWKNKAVFTDAWRPDEAEQEIPENELQAGEMSAVIFKVGCYHVRSAWRVYKKQDDLKIPADKEEVELAKGKLKGTVKMTIDVLRYMELPEKMCVVHEISAKHMDNPNNTYTNVCSIAQSRSVRWCEYVGDIYTVKENESIPDEYASLLVYTHFSGDSFGADTWYKLDPTGKITKLDLHPFNSNLDEESFVEPNVND